MRVYAYGLAYGVGERSDARWGERYREGKFRADGDADRYDRWLGIGLQRAWHQWSDG